MKKCDELFQDYLNSEVGETHVAFKIPLPISSVQLGYFHSFPANFPPPLREATNPSFHPSISFPFCKPPVYINIKPNFSNSLPPPNVNLRTYTNKVTSPRHFSSSFSSLSSTSSSSSAAVPLTASSVLDSTPLIFISSSSEAGVLFNRLCRNRECCNFSSREKLTKNRVLGFCKESCVYRFYNLRKPKMHNSLDRVLVGYRVRLEEFLKNADKDGLSGQGLLDGFNVLHREMQDLVGQHIANYNKRE